MRRSRAVSYTRLVVLVSGTGSNLQALLDAAAGDGFGARVVAVGADRDGIAGLERARAAGIPTFVRRVKDFPGKICGLPVGSHRKDGTRSTKMCNAVTARNIPDCRLAWCFRKKRHA